jgi:hypothetical protein
MKTVQITDVEFDFEEELEGGFHTLSEEVQEKVYHDVVGNIFEIDCDPEEEGFDEFEYLICEEITSETGWMVKQFEYIMIETKD